MVPEMHLCQSSGRWCLVGRGEDSLQPAIDDLLTRRPQLLDEAGETHGDAFRDRWAALVGATVVVLMNRFPVQVNCWRVVSRGHRHFLRTLCATARWEIGERPHGRESACPAVVVGRRPHPRRLGFWLLLRATVSPRFSAASPPCVVSTPVARHSSHRFRIYSDCYLPRDGRQPQQHRLAAVPTTPQKSRAATLQKRPRPGITHVTYSSSCPLPTPATELTHPNHEHPNTEHQVPEHPNT